MPRPTPVQFLYGSATVVLSTLAMLVLSGVSSGPGVALVVVVALALGVLVAVTLAMPWAAAEDEEDGGREPRSLGGEPSLRG